MIVCPQCLGAKATQGLEDVLDDRTGVVAPNPGMGGAVPCSQCGGKGYY